MGPDACRNWDYEKHHNHHLVAQRCIKLLDYFRAKHRRFDKFQHSTLVGHRYMFRHLTPKECPCLAGNYRGSKFDCLENYNVGVEADRRVGTPAPYVHQEMVKFEGQLRTAIDTFEQQFSLLGKPGSTVTAGALLIFYIKIVSAALQVFLTIHPYANGNGHMGRLLVWILLGRANYWPKKWPLDDSPNYYQALTEHRNGNRAMLENFILSCMH